jgi:polyhydroxyalkanoate synthase
MAADALAGLRAYETAFRPEPPPPRPEVARVVQTCLRDHGGAGAPAVLIPSLINPPTILDLDPDVSLADAVAAMGRRALLLDWGEADARSELTVGGHVSELLLPLLDELGEPAALIGYCLGGTMAVAAANISTCERVATLAAPWNFAGYPDPSREALRYMWNHSDETSRSLGALPMEVLQAAFWSLDAERTVQKFAEFGHLDPEDPRARRFVTLEDWANEGRPLPYPAAKELIEGLFGENLSGSGRWKIGDQCVIDELPVPALHLTADHDRIAPAATAPSGQRLGIGSGHVGMIVGSARGALHEALRHFLDPGCC